MSTFSMFVFEEALKKMRIKTKTPAMVVCHPDDYDAVYDAMKDAGVLAMGTMVKATIHMEKPGTTYLIWDLE